MQSAALRAATASDPLTLAEEHAMQQSWRQDADKLTFIVCQPLPTAAETLPADAETIYLQFLTPGVRDGAGDMLGDINLFFSLPPSSRSHSPSPSPSQPLPPLPTPVIITGEINLMIPHLPTRRQGHGRAALLTFLRYIFAHEVEIVSSFLSAQSPHQLQPREPHAQPQTQPQLQAPLLPHHPPPQPPALQRSSISTSQNKAQSAKLILLAKIDKDNKPSIALFEGVGFVRRGGESYFGEVELVFDPETRTGFGGGRGLEEVERLMERVGVLKYTEIRYGDGDGQGEGARAGD